MDSSLSTFLSQYFSRFFVSGLVFYLIAAWLPLVLFNTDQDAFVDLLNNPAFIIVVSLIAGIILDISKAYDPVRKAIRGEKLGKERLDPKMLRAFSISYDKELLTNEMVTGGKSPYMDAITQVATRIYDDIVFRHSEEEFRKIRDARIIPDIMSAALLSIWVSAIVVIAIVSTPLLECLVENGVCYSPNAGTIVGILIWFLLVGVITRRAWKKIGKRYDELDAITAGLLRDAFGAIQTEKRGLAFMDELIKDQLIQKADDGSEFAFELVDSETRTNE